MNTVSTMQTQVVEVYGNENSLWCKGEDGWRRQEMGTGRVVGCQWMTFPPDNLLGWQVSWYQTVCKQSDGTLKTHTHTYTQNSKLKIKLSPSFRTKAAYSIVGNCKWFFLIRSLAWSSNAKKSIQAYCVTHSIPDTVRSELLCWVLLCLLFPRTRKSQQLFFLLVGMWIKM